MIGRLLVLTLILLGVRILSAAMVVGQPGFTDAYYYVDVARRLAHGQGLSADFVWNFIEAPRFAPVPVPSHRFWMPLASVVQAAGIVALEPVLGAFRAAQAAIIAVAIFVPLATYAAARAVGATPRSSLVAAAIAGIGGGAFAPAWVTLDSFAVAALVGTCFFLALGRAGAGDPRAGVVAGVLVGLLFLARAEGAFFGLALIWLAARPVSRIAGLAGSAAALVIGLAWLARGLALGGGPDLLARTALLFRYEDFFAIVPTATADLGTIVGARIGALAYELQVAAFSLLLFLAVPLIAGIRAAWRLPAVRAYAALAVGLYLVEALVWPLHATRGSYFHSLAALYPFAIGLVARGADAFSADRGAAVWRAGAAGAIVATAAVAVVAHQAWDASFNTGYTARSAAVDAIPPGPFLAIDAAAWRWIADRTALVTPADGIEMAACVVARYGARSVVLEPAHFSAYRQVYDGTIPSWLEPAVDRDGVKVFRVKEAPPCLPSVAWLRLAADTEVREVVP